MHPYTHAQAFRIQALSVMHHIFIFIIHLCTRISNIHIFIYMECFYYHSTSWTHGHQSVAYTQSRQSKLRTTCEHGQQIEINQKFMSLPFKYHRHSCVLASFFQLILDEFGQIMEDQALPQQEQTHWHKGLPLYYHYLRLQ